MGKLNDKSFWKRICPECKKEIQYNKYVSWYQANKKNSMCQKCHFTGKNHPSFGKKWSDERKENRSKKYIGAGNPFYGKHHTLESKLKLIKSRKKSYENSKYKTKEYRELQSKLNIGKNNPMYGKSVYDVWVSKYGKDIAEKKMDDFRKKISNATKGEKNPMYGKPAPIGSGNGWNGWYRGWYFRSLLELSYMIKVIEKYNLKWQSAEKKEYKIQYTYENKKYNYFADFLIENKYLIEMKPKKLWKSNIVIRKKSAAIDWCNNNNYIYKIRDVKKLNIFEINKLYVNNEIKFTEKTFIKFSKWLKRKKII